MLVLSGVILIVLGIIAYQDFRYREVYWICFPLLAILFSIYKITTVGLSALLTDIIFTGGFLLLQFLILWLYFCIKYRKTVNLTNGYLGWGDILFLLAICFYLSPVNYIVFYVVSLVVSIVYALFTRLLSEKEELTIPLAGIQALIFALILIVERSARLNFYGDTSAYYNWLLH
ncbi:hypothetical protein TH53_18725 [Pedobacter lusitanus]|uniref:Prepilin type IV endopeptidase peptidase domain-containing protein n=1 Tax=Pedobacter lusitanus TaxID=1503925 RepID=A0A0D0GMT5_9SPHI|nr:hypothetical protein [Pedobacter lusitanus]KIO75756.1 hypothetical protein TH53_18725 [Pedobacter lusitanus]